MPVGAHQVALPPAQIDAGPVMEQVGFVLTVKILLQDEVHPFASVTVTAYVPEVVTLMQRVVAPLLH